MPIKKLFVCIVPLCMCACNSVYVKKNSLAPSELFYVDRGGDQLQHEIKNALEERGYHITIGRKKSTTRTTYISADTNSESKARYIITINEKEPTLKPIWCVFNGFWWWRFNLSIADNETGQEILAWRGRMCANSAIRKLNRLLDDMEIGSEK
ncbi:MAG: hypothetical protein KBS86_02910 [Proteobacteria bacterium]|nr:hypothetical protein [Candidatus Enterousia scatequi]